jgi:glycosyltransferase involved in cell wall biosynthesis
VNSEIKKSDSLVSVIMPLYNKQAYVRRATESVQKQTYRNWELIIVDDGSTDGSFKEIPKSEERIRLFQQQNSGPGAARNRAIREAKGHFVAFLDADDYYYPGKLEKETMLLNSNSGVDWMISAAEYEKGNDVKLKNIYDAKGKAISKSTAVIKDVIRQLSVHWPINSLCLKRSLIERLKGFREDMLCYEVTDFIFRCALVEPAALICSTPLSRQVDVSQSTFKDLRQRIEGLRMLGETLYKLGQEHSNYSSRLEILSRDMMLDYSGKLILWGAKIKSRQYLTRDFVYKKNLKWWKMWFASWLPDPVIKRIRVSRYPLTAIWLLSCNLLYASFFTN